MACVETSYVGLLKEKISEVSGLLHFMRLALLLEQMKHVLNSMRRLTWLVLILLCILQGVTELGTPPSTPGHACPHPDRLLPS